MADIEIIQGKTLSLVFRPEQETYTYSPITAIAKTAPVSITATAHGVPNGWRVAIVSVLGMTQINAENDPPKDKEFVKATVVDANTITINSVNALRFSTYTSSGAVQYYTPVDLSTASARMQIRDKVGGTLLASTELADAPLNTITVAVDAALRTVTFGVSATSTAAITWKKGIFDAELVIGADVSLLDAGAVVVSKEVTT